jgi:hypothetical protein
MTRPPAPSPSATALNLVIPPYTAVESLADAPPLGSFFLLEVDESVDGWSVVESLREAPWVPLVLVQRSAYVPPALLTALQGLRGTPAFIWRRPDDGLPINVLAQDAVRGRPAPDPDQVACWVGARIGRVELASSLVVAMASPPPRSILARLSPAGRWLERRLRSISPLTPTDWRETFHLATAAGNTRLTTAQAAQRLGCDIWTLRRRLERLAGVTTDQYRLLAGWEWFLEAVVRKWSMTGERREVRGER